MIRDTPVFPTASPASPAADDQRPPELVVLVDDDIANRIVFEQSFKHHFNLLTCDSGPAALEILERSPIAVLLTDQRMPGMTGIELLRLVRERSPCTVGVVVTAHEDTRPMLEAVNQQLASRYLIKPWTAAELQTVVEWGIEVYRLSKDKTELEMKLLQAERLTTLGSIAAGVLHDLKQPLASLHSNLEGLGRLIARGDAQAVIAQAPEVLEDMQLASRQLGEMAESAQRYLSTGQSARGVGDPKLAARYTATLCRHKVAAHGGALRVQVDDRLPAVRLSTTALTQVMVNLVVNAAQALLSGRRSSVVELRVAREGAGVSVRVRDNGRGMSSEVLARAQEAFFTTKGSGVGSGLGLYNTQRLATDAGGRFLLSSVEDEGTTATVWLPAAEDSGADLAP